MCYGAERIFYVIKTLREFRHENESGFDEGQIIRVKAKELVSLLNDEERLREERSMNTRNRRADRASRPRPRRPKNKKQPTRFFSLLPGRFGKGPRGEQNYCSRR